MSSRAVLPILFLLIFLMGCSLEPPTPALIASYPGQPGQDRQQTPADPHQMVVRYSADLTIAVTDVKGAILEATDRVQRHGGYVSSLRSWQSGGRTHASMVVNVPTRQFGQVRLELHGIGDLVRESISGDPISPATGFDPRTPFSQLRLHIQPQSSRLITLVNAFRGMFARDYQILLSYSRWSGFLSRLLAGALLLFGPFIWLGWWLRGRAQANRR